MEAEGVDGSGLTVQTAPALCVAGCRKEVSPCKEISPT